MATDILEGCLGPFPFHGLLLLSSSVKSLSYNGMWSHPMKEQTDQQSPGSSCPQLHLVYQCCQKFHLHQDLSYYTVQSLRIVCLVSLIEHLPVGTLHDWWVPVPQAVTEREDL